MRKGPVGVPKTFHDESHQWGEFSITFTPSKVSKLGKTIHARYTAHCLWHKRMKANGKFKLCTHSQGFDKDVDGAEDYCLRYLYHWCNLSRTCFTRKGHNSLLKAYKPYQIPGHDELTANMIADNAGDSDVDIDGPEPGNDDSD